MSVKFNFQSGVPEPVQNGLSVPLPIGFVKIANNVEFKDFQGSLKIHSYKINGGE